MRLLVTGGGGLLGSEVARIARARGHGVIAAARPELDVTEKEALSEIFAVYRPDWVAHCAAYTAVDQAEEEVEEAMRVNRDGTRNVVEAAAEVDARVAHVSTDYVFAGEKGSPYQPDDPVGPLSAYARSKVAAEEVAREGGALVVRLGWLYGGGGGNFVRAILARARAGESLKVVDDQAGRPTWARNAAEALVELMERGCEGVWHVADGGSATWHELAVAAVELAGLRVRVSGVSTKAWGAPAPRPAYSVMDTSATEELLGRPPEAWRVALGRFLEEERARRPEESGSQGIGQG